MINLINKLTICKEGCNLQYYMALRDEIVIFLDKNGLVAPNRVGPNGGSDNGPCFTSELYAMYKKSDQLTEQDKIDYAQKIGSCIDSNGLLNRVPIGQLDGQEGPDDYYAVLNGCKSMGNTSIPRKFLKSVVKYLGFLNNENPGKKTLSSFLVRQPQLLACMVAAAFPSFSNPLHFFIRLIAMPLFFIAAVSIAISCVNAPASDTDARRLAWHLWQCTKPVSLMCRLAGKLWLRRLYRTYPDGMKGVAKLYYQNGHPFAKYWITE